MPSNSNANTKSNANTNASKNTGNAGSGIMKANSGNSNVKGANVNALVNNSGNASPVNASPVNASSVNASSVNANVGKMNVGKMNVDVELPNVGELSLEGGKRNVKKSFKIVATDNGVPVPTSVFRNKDSSSASKKAGTAVMKRVPLKKKSVTFTLKNLNTNKQLNYTVTRGKPGKPYVIAGKTFTPKESTIVKACKALPTK